MVVKILYSERPYFVLKNENGFSLFKDGVLGIPIKINDFKTLIECKEYIKKRIIK